MKPETNTRTTHPCTPACFGSSLNIKLSWIPQWSCFNLGLFRFFPRSERAGLHLREMTAWIWGARHVRIWPHLFIILPRAAPRSIYINDTKSSEPVRALTVAVRVTHARAACLHGWGETPAPHAQRCVARWLWRTSVHWGARQEKSLLIKLTSPSFRVTAGEMILSEGTWYITWHNCNTFCNKLLIIAFLEITRGHIHTF